MKKIYIILLLMTIGILITGCNHKKEVTKEEIKYEGDTAPDVTMTIKEGTVTNKCATIIIKDFSKKDYNYDKYYSLFKKVNNDYILIHSNANNGPMKLIKYGITDSGIMEIEECWPEVEPGEYKIVKHISDSNDVYSFSANFVID